MGQRGRVTIQIESYSYDSLRSAEEDFIRFYPSATGWNLNPRWADDDTILLDVPAHLGIPPIVGRIAVASIYLVIPAVKGTAIGSTQSRAQSQSQSHDIHEHGIHECLCKLRRFSC